VYVTGRTKTLQQLHPEYTTDWNQTLNDRDEERLLHPAADADHRPGQVFARVLSESVDRVISGRNPWSWMVNSCHLDTWLMVELSFFGRLASSNVTPLTDQVALSSTALMKLFKVLISVGHTTQDNMKMAYWAMEIEDYQGGSRQARKTFKLPTDYQKHGEFLQIQDRRTANMNITTLSLGMKATCTNPDHTIARSVLKRVPHIPVEDYWYTLPDDWTRTKGSDGRWKTDQCHQVRHADLEDVVETLLGRSDGETSNCPTCSKTHPGTSYQISWEKYPSLSMLPLCLEYTVDPDSNVPVSEKLNIGGLEYTLLAIVFGDGGHFKCNVLLRDNWYHYDDLGFAISVPKTGNNPSPPRLVRINHPDTFSTTPPPTGGFKPISYRYIRDDISTMEPVVMPRSESITKTLQFNSMWRLLVQGYDNLPQQ
jgi:hypothetical protein